MPTNKLLEDKLNEWAKNWRRQQEEMSRQSQYQTQNHTPYNTSAPNWQQTPYQPQAQSFAAQPAAPQQPQQVSAQTSVLSPEIANAAFQKGFTSKQKSDFPLKNAVNQAMPNMRNTAFYPVYGGAQTVYNMGKTLYKTGEEIGEKIGEGVVDYRTYDPYTDVPNVISPNQTYIQNVTNLAKEAKRVGVMNLGDDKKHQYVSCFGASNGMPITIGTAGVLKEGIDTYKKISNPRLKNQYGGTFGVLADSLKDLTNDAYGLYLGYTGNDCGRILKKDKI